MKPKAPGLSVNRGGLFNIRPVMGNAGYSILLSGTGGSGSAGFPST